MEAATEIVGDARRVLTDLVTGDPDRLRRRSLALGVAWDDAEDVAQMALLRAWRSIAHVDLPQPGRVCSWLDAIARNIVKDLARQRARRPEAPFDLDTPDPSDVAKAVEVRLLLDAALAALAALPESLREPLLLSAVDGLSTQQIAARLGVEPATARQRISRARKALDRGRQADQPPTLTSVA